MKTTTKLERAIANLAETLLDDTLNEAQYFNAEERSIGEPEVVKTKSDLAGWIGDRCNEIGPLIENEALRMLKKIPATEIKKRIKSSK